MEREMKLLYECSFEELVEELKARFPDGTIVAVANNSAGYSIRTHGYLGALDQLSVHTREHVLELMENNQ